MSFAINGSLVREQLAAELAASGRLQIANFLDPAAAAALRDYLAGAKGWRHALNAGGNVYEIGCDELAAMDEALRAELEARVDREAARQFQFRFDTIRVPDAAAERHGNLLHDFATFLSSPEMIAWFRALTGCAGIDFADCQATRYCPGHFLTRHDDDVEGKQRHFAYVLGLTAGWRAEWGGLLLFPGDGEAAPRIDALVPNFNLLTLFPVGQQHAVSQVASYAPEPRLSVTGWLRGFG